MSNKRKKIENLLKEIKYFVYLLLIFLFSGLFILLLNFLMGFFEISFVLILLIYAILISALGYISIKFENNYLLILTVVLGLPVWILFFVYPAIIVLMVLVVFVYVASLVPTLIVLLLEAYEISVSDHLRVYLLITIVSIISMSFTKKTLNLAYHLARLKSSKKIQALNIEPTIEYVLNRKNIRGFIYGMYFLFLIYYSVSEIENSMLPQRNSMNMAIMQSFLTVVAYDSFISNIEKVSVLPSTLFNKLFDSIKKSFIEID